MLSRSIEYMGGVLWEVLRSYNPGVRRIARKEKQASAPILDLKSGFQNTKTISL
jgi:hypothetical protein